MTRFRRTTFKWTGLAESTGLTRREDTDYDHGNPVPGWLIPDILDGLL